MDILHKKVMLSSAAPRNPPLLAANPNKSLLSLTLHVHAAMLRDILAM